RTRGVQILDTQRRPYGTSNGFEHGSRAALTTQGLQLTGLARGDLLVPPFEASTITLLELRTSILANAGKQVVLHTEGLVLYDEVARHLVRVELLGASDFLDGGAQRSLDCLLISGDAHLAQSVFVGNKDPQQVRAFAGSVKISLTNRGMTIRVQCLE